MRVGAAILGLVTLAPGCAGDAVVDGQPAVPLLTDAGWIADVVAQPEAFASRLETDGRDGWIQLHGNQWDAALTAFPSTSVGAARATRDLAVQHADLARLAAVAWPMLRQEWQSRSPEVADGPLPLLAGAALAAVGDADGARLQVAGRTDAQLVEALLVDQVLSGQAPPAPPGAAPQQDCFDNAAAVITGRSSAPLESCLLGQPLDLDQGEFYNPIVHAALAAQWHRTSADMPLQAPTASAPADPALLFGPWWSGDDLSAALAADPVLATATGAGPAGLRLPDAGSEDLPQAARERVRALDLALDAWSTDMQDSASPQGRALLTDLQLVPQARMHLLLTWARQALAQDRPHQATAYLQLAHDLEHAREVGPLNPPTRFILAAEASLRTGRTREALDHLSVLAASTPTVRGLTETIGDLAVLEGLGRQGDSKEL